MIVIEEIAAERTRQITKEGWTHAHDDSHSDEELAMAAALYAAPRPLYDLKRHGGCCPIPFDPWPWREYDANNSYHGVVMVRMGFKPHGRRRRLVIAAAMIVAEIERMDRAAVPNS